MTVQVLHYTTPEVIEKVIGNLTQTASHKKQRSYITDRILSNPNSHRYEVLWGLLQELIVEYLGSFETLM